MKLFPLLLVTLVVLSGCSRGPSQGGQGGTQNGGGQTTVQTQSNGRGEAEGQSAGARGAILAAPDGLSGTPGSPRELWRRSQGAPVSASPAPVGSVIVVGFADFTVRGFSASDGIEVWSHRTDSLPLSISALGSSAVVADAGSVMRLASADGAEEWKADVAVATGSQVRSSSRAVYVPTSSGQLVALAPANGQRIWTTDLGVASGASAAGAIEALDGVLYACTSDGQLVAVSATGGEIRWRQQVSDGFAAGPAVTGRGAAAVDTRGRVFAFAPDSGEWKHTATAPGVVTVSPIPAGGMLYVGLANGSVVEFGPETWEFALVGEASKGPSDAGRNLFASGTDLAGQPALLGTLLVVADSSGVLHGVDLTGGVPPVRASIHMRVVGEFAYDGVAVFAAGADGTLSAMAFDVPPETVPLLSADRVWDLPPGGRFRLSSRYVEIRQVVEAGPVAEWVFSSDLPDDELSVTVLDEGGNAIATGVDGVATAGTARLPLPPGEYRVRVERLFADPSAVVTLSLQPVE